MTSPQRYYKNLVALGVLQSDAKQCVALEKLEDLHNTLLNYNPRKKGFSLRGFFSNEKTQISDMPQGLYLHGSVGCGKTVLLKAFFETAPTTQKVYMHFHTFLLDINKRLSKYTEGSVVDPLDCIAKDLFKDNWLYCFDECVVGDVGDAMLFGRIVESILQQGGVIVATSNFAPEHLKPRGAGADIFKPYVDYFFERTIGFDMDSAIDYRSEHRNGWENYLYPLNSSTKDKLQGITDNLTKGITITPETLYVRGHGIYLSHTGAGVACSTYNDLLAKPYGVEDFIALARAYSTLVVSGIPKISADNTALAKRFILLVDAYYEAGGKIILSADCSPDMLYERGPVKFEFERALSRLASFNT